MNIVPAPDRSLYPAAPPAPAVPAETHDALILRHLPQVQLVARSLAASLPGHVLLADLIGAGVLGLIDAVSKFDPTRDTSLSTYAQFRIRGAILDSLRSQDWGPRRVRLLARRIADARHELSTTLLRTPTEAEIAAHLGSSLADYQAHLTEWRRLKVENFTTADPAGEDGSSGPVLEDVPSPDPDALQLLLGHEETKRLAAAVAALPTGQREVVTLYYLEEMNMREIGLAMGITESRVCQIHRAALHRLKKTWDRRRQPRRP